MIILCKGNIVAVTEELSQLDVLFNFIEDPQKEMVALDEAIYGDDQWFDELDEKTFAIKQKVYSWLKLRGNLMMLNQEDQVPRRDQADHQSHQGHQSHHQRRFQSEATVLRIKLCLRS